MVTGNDIRILEFIDHNPNCTVFDISVVLKLSVDFVTKSCNKLQTKELIGSNLLDKDPSYITYEEGEELLYYLADI